MTSYADSIYLCQWDDIFRTFEHIKRNQPTLIQLNSKEQVHKFWKEGVNIEIRIGTSIIYFNVTFCIHLFTKKKLTFCVWINHWKTNRSVAQLSIFHPPLTWIQNDHDRGPSFIKFRQIRKYKKFLWRFAHNF